MAELRGSQMTLNFAESMDGAAAATENGEVFTRRWVVELILDLCGYRAEVDLASTKVVEPACGTGAFLEPIVERLIESCMLHGVKVTEAFDAIVALDLVEDNVLASRSRVAGQLQDHGIEPAAAHSLAKGWIRQGDFLLADHEAQAADFVLGNPPYIRLENLPPGRNAAYRRACPTMRGRSDIFVGFIEMGLRTLRPSGVLGFIVADRWMRNQYGANLREFITGEFSVEAVIEMHDVEAFDDAVSAYPAVTVIRRSNQRQVLVASAKKGFGERAAEELRGWAVKTPNGALRNSSVRAAWLPGWFTGNESWPWGTPEQLALVAELESRLPPLQDATTGTRVGIGLATGADDVYLTNNPDLVEPERLMPIAMAKDLADGEIRWSGTYLVNPWSDAGLVDLDEWPRFRSHLENHGAQVRRRHTAQKAPDRWHRTIDRVTPGLREQPKLLLPEMKAAAHPVLDDGRYYPHHNLYHITSTGWDLEVLGGLMLSDITNLFVGTYCVKMRGGCYRFQAQYLRRVRVPSIESISSENRRALARAFLDRDAEAATAVALKVCGVGQLPAGIGL